MRKISLSSIILILIITVSFIDYPELFGKTTKKSLNFLEPHIKKILMPADNTELGTTPGIWFARTISFGLIIILLCIDFFYPLKKNPGFIYKMKLFIIFILVLIILIIPTLKFIIARYNSEPYRFVHDSIINTELAIERLKKGINTYSVDNYGTALEKWGAGRDNPPIVCYTYMPLNFVLGVPFQILFTHLPYIKFYDQRFLHIILLVISFFLIPKIVNDYEMKLVLLSLIMFNPFLIQFFREGRSSIFNTFWLIPAVIFLQKRYWKLTALFVGLALCSKQTMILAIPYFFGYIFIELYNETKKFKIAIKKFCVQIIPFIIVCALVILPFAIWDFKEFYHDTYLGPLGKARVSWPMAGRDTFGFATIVLYYSWSKSTNTNYPFVIYQIIFALPVLILSLYFMFKNNSLPLMLFSYSLFSIIYLYFSRHLYPHYAGEIFMFIFIAYALYNDNKIDRPI